MSPNDLSARLCALLGLLLLAMGLAGCGGGGSAAPGPSSAGPAVSAPASSGAPAVSLLFLGNSHTGLNNVPGLVAALYMQARPGQTVHAEAAPGWLFLDERLNDAATLAVFNARPWTHVVLQAQRYSSSGQVDYPTTEAQEWVRRSRAAGALPVMFPEWPRFGVAETARIDTLYRGIAQAAGACMSPVPQAFDEAARRYPGLVLHASDGNHSSPEGALLAAYILYASASNARLDSVETLVASPVAAATQRQLRDIAIASLAAGPDARAHCPV